MKPPPHSKITVFVIIATILALGALGWDLIEEPDRLPDAAKRNPDTFKSSGVAPATDAGSVADTGPDRIKSINSAVHAGPPRKVGEVGSALLLVRPFATEGVPCKLEFVSKGTVREVITRVDNCLGEQIQIHWSPSAASNYVLYVSATGFAQRAITLRDLLPISKTDLGEVALQASRVLIIRLHSDIDHSGALARVSSLMDGVSRVATIRGQVATFGGVTPGQWSFAVNGLAEELDPHVIRVREDVPETHAAVVVVAGSSAIFRGRVMMPQGVPAAGVTVRCGAVPKTVSTDDRGDFSFAVGVKDRVGLRISDQDHRIEEVVVAPMDPPDWRGRIVEISAKESSFVELVGSNKLSALRIIPINGGYMDEPLMARPTTSTSGQLRCRGIPDGRSVLFCRFPSEFYAWGTPHVVNTRDSLSLRLTVHPFPPSKLRCIAQDSDGNALPGSNVDLVTWINIGISPSKHREPLTMNQLSGMKESAWCIVDTIMAKGDVEPELTVPLVHDGGWGVHVSVPGYRDSVVTAREWRESPDGLTCIVVMRRLQ